jgi:transcriptional regulator with XRE-family HTH domain
MRKKKGEGVRPIAQELIQTEIEKRLSKIGSQLKTIRADRTSLESFAYEINVSRSSMTRYEAGGDMYLSTFLKVLHGLDIAPEEFFKTLEK